MLNSNKTAASLHRLVPKKWATEDETISVVTEGERLEQPSLTKVKGIILDDDASSTSSCSCEDHSSVANKSEEDLNNQDLDYGEDSVVGSPEDPTTEKNVESPIDVDVGLIDSSPGVDNIETSSQEAKKSDSQSNASQLEDTAVDRSKLDLQKTHKLMSFVNRNHQNESQALDLMNNNHSPINKSGRSYSYLMKHFFKDAVYFQMKSINHENVELSKSLGVWSTPVLNEVRLNAAFQHHRNVILIFSVQQSGAFQGFARMVSQSKPPTRPIPWILPERLSSKSLGGVFKLEWLCKKQLPFFDTHDLFNPYNENKPIKVARDGQQVEPKVGKRLCKLFPEDSKEQLHESISTLKRQVSQRKRSTRKNGDFYPLVHRRELPSVMRGSAMSYNSHMYTHQPNFPLYHPPIHPPSVRVPPDYRAASFDHGYEPTDFRNPTSAAARFSRHYSGFPGEPAPNSFRPVAYQQPYFDHMTNSPYNFCDGWSSMQEHRGPHHRPARR